MRARRVLVCLASLLGLLAAGTAGAGISAVSLKGGLCLAQFHGDLPTSALVTNEYRSSAGGGMAMTIGSGPWSFQPEALYVSKGTSFGKSELTNSSGVLTGTIETSLVVNYLELPLLARVGFRPGETVSPYLVAGPTVGFRTSQNFQSSGTVESSIGVELFRSADLGVAFGSGFEVGRGAYRGLFEARYTVGLTTASLDTYSTSARNGALLIMAGLSLHP